MVAAARLVLLLLGCVGLLQPAGSRYVSYCPKGWSYYKLSCFGYFRQPQSWDEAERQCQSKHPGAHLAWVEEPREVATLRRIISYYQRVKPRGHVFDPPLSFHRARPGSGQVGTSTASPVGWLGTVSTGGPVAC
uniref:C-type lectin domain-containing protein n=1 Tax=Buteo japonicus TaxID=224669 RepID=A0A8C0B4P6_9AVES